MAQPFKQKHGVELDAVLFAIWAASFFGTYTGLTSHLTDSQSASVESECSRKKRSISLAASGPRGSV
jgi:hypothetical protein